MRAFLEYYGLKWVNKEKREGEFKLEALMRDLNAARKDSVYNLNPKSINLLDLDLLREKIIAVNQKQARNYKSRTHRNKEKEPDSIKLKTRRKSNVQTDSDNTFEKIIQIEKERRRKESEDKQAVK